MWSATVIAGKPTPGDGVSAAALGATEKACGVFVDEVAGEKLGTTPVDRSCGERGNHLGAALSAEPVPEHRRSGGIPECRSNEGTCSAV